MPASGKSLWAKRLANALHIKSFDTDALVTAKACKTIPEIFNKDGEAAFRLLEHEVLEGICKSNDDFVLSTGGGMPCYYNNMGLMNMHGITIWLNENPGFIAQRIINKKAERPMFASLTDEDVKNKVQQLYEERKIFYAQSAHHLSSDNINIKHLLNLIEHA